MALDHYKDTQFLAIVMMMGIFLLGMLAGAALAGVLAALAGCS